MRSVPALAAFLYAATAPFPVLVPVSVTSARSRRAGSTETGLRVHLGLPTRV